MAPFRKQLHIIRQRAQGRMVAVRKRRPHKRIGRERMRKFGVNRYRYLAAVPMLLLAILLTAWIKTPDMNTVRFRPLRRAIVNPLCGWAVDAALDPAAVEIDNSLVHATLSWRELEPREGEFDFDAFETKNHMAAWREKGVRMVLRFVLDRPSSEEHTDIPDWLLEAMGEDAGTAYATPMAGLGFSPNYNHPLLLQKHGEALSALGARYNGDPFLAFVEMGSLGHDGEWWVDREAGVPALPLLPEARGYIGAYSFAFPGTPLLAVNPYQSVKLLQGGLYNPFLGDADRTWNWIDMATYGGYEEQIGTDLRGMGEYFKSVPAGAQLSDQLAAQRLLATAPESLLEQIRECHPSYVSGAPATGLSETEQSNMRIAQELMGYRLWVRSASWAKQRRPGENLHISLLFRNSGVAPIAQSWPMTLHLIRDGEIRHSQALRLDTRTLLPGETRVEADLEIPFGLEAGAWQLGLSVDDPATGVPAVELAMVCIKHGLVSVLGDVKLVE